MVFVCRILIDKEIVIRQFKGQEECMTAENSPASATWWAVACSEEVTAKKPLSVDIGDQPLVLWRDQNGVARALEDRCPHRRAPLSRGCIRSNGLIQCGYHGWSYDGETGRLKDIPNMKSEQRFPPLYKAQSYAVAEAGGFVRVSLEARSAAAAMAPAIGLHGVSYIGLAHGEYVSALFDAPGLLLSIRGVSFTPYLAAELRLEGGRLVMERNCQWQLPHWPAPFSSEFPISLQSSTNPVTGETVCSLRDSSLTELLTATIAPVPAARGVTAIRWRARLGKNLPGLWPRQLALGAAFKVFDSINAAALRAVIPSVSIRGADLRAEFLQTSQAEAA
jgi:nitrite reductase/ring-hydroxylating ferredoxin subunit